MDSFYASCELLRHPELNNKAFIVGTAEEANKHKGVVEAANYLAKRTGIRSAMAVTAALKIKPDIVYVESDHDYYDEMSRKVMETLGAYGKKMEVLSIDEAALDLDAMSYGEAEKLAKKIKVEINENIGLPCTIGIADGKIFAKMVCDEAKPDGLKMVKQEDIKDFLKSKRTQRIPGVGPKTSERLEAMGIKTIEDIAKTDPMRLSEKIGSFGRELYVLANGRDESQIVSEWKVQSISRERTLERRTNDLLEVNKMLDMLADEVIADANARELSFKTISVKARYSDFSEKIKSKSFSNYSNSIELLKNTAHELMKELVGEKPFRKVGVRIASFSEGRGQKKLF